MSSGSNRVHGGITPRTHPGSALFPTPELFRPMGLRHWLRQQMAGDLDGEDVPPGTSLLNTLWGREEQRLHALGEYDATTYPRDLSELLARREEVTSELLGIDIADPEARVEAIPRLREMLRTYPHPLVYETLIHAYVDAGRYDEAKGVAFAASERRLECSRSEYPEIRSEIEHLSEWSPGDIEDLRSRRNPEARGGSA